jgi:hypothetical protein
MAQRVMQYGWDFAGLWFEMWNKMSASGAAPWGPVSAPPPPASATSDATTMGSAPPAPVSAATPSESAGASERLVVSVAADRPTTTSIELRPGSNGTLHVHALRPEDHDGPAIREVSIAPKDADGTITISVIVPPETRAGIYNGLIIDQATNLPRGTLSVRVADKKG